MPPSLGNIHGPATPAASASGSVFPLDLIYGKIIGAALKERLVEKESPQSQDPITITYHNSFFHIPGKFYAKCINRTEPIILDVESFA